MAPKQEEVFHPRIEEVTSSSEDEDRGGNDDDGGGPAKNDTATTAPAGDEESEGLDWGKQHGNKLVAAKDYAGAIKSYEAALRWAKADDAVETRVAVLSNITLCHLRLHNPHAAVTAARLDRRTPL